MASNHHSFEDFATAVAWEAGKLLVMERVKVAPPKAMEMRIRVKYTSVYHIELLLLPKGFPGTFTSSEYIVVHSGCLSKIKPLAQLDKICILSCVIPTGLGSPLNVAKRKIILSCLLASLLLKVEKFRRCQSIGVESVDLKPKRFDEVYNVHTAKEKTETSTSAEAPDRTNCR